jgi:hypothetical protein
MHEAEIALGDDFSDGQPVAAIAQGDLGRESKMAGDKAVRRLRILMFPPPLGQHVLFIFLQQRVFADLG